MLVLKVLDHKLVVWRLPSGLQIPTPPEEGFFCLTKTCKEISVVSESTLVPLEVQHSEPGWRAMVVEGPLAFELSGVLASLCAPLAEAEISVFAISTYDTDYLLVKENNFARAISVLGKAGHTVK